MESNLLQQDILGAGPTHTGMLVVDPKYQEEIEGFLKQNYSFNQFQELLGLFQSNDILSKHKGIIGIRKILSIQEEPPIAAIVDSEIIPKLIEYLKQTEFPQMRLEAAWIITNVASGTSEQCKELVDLGVIPIFVGLLGQKEEGIVEQAIWGLGNIASDCIQFRNAVIAAGGVQGLIGITNKFSNQILIKHCAWALSNLCRGKPSPTASLVADIIPVLCKLLVQGKISDKNIIGDCCWAITYHSHQNDQIDVVIKSGVVPFLVKLLNQKNAMLLIPAVRTLGNLASGTSEQTEELLKHNIFSSLQKLLVFPKGAIVIDACWMLSNIAAGTKMQVDALLKCHSLIKKLVDLLETGKNDVKKQILYLFTNIGNEGNGEDVFNVYKEYKLIHCFANILKLADSGILRVALDCLSAIFKSGDKHKAVPENPFALQFEEEGALTYLQALQTHPCVELFEKAAALLHQYFDVEAEAEAHEK